MHRMRLDHIDQIIMQITQLSIMSPLRLLPPQCPCNKRRPVTRHILLPRLARRSRRRSLWLQLLTLTLLWGVQRWRRNRIIAIVHLILRSSHAREWDTSTLGLIAEPGYWGQIVGVVLVVVGVVGT